MISRYFRSRKNEDPKKRDKEISLVVDNVPPEDSPFVVKVAKSLLVKHSAVFEKMAENKELKKCKEIKMKGVTVTGLQKMVEYIKVGSVFFQNHFEVIETLKAAYLYQVQGINEVCGNFLINFLNCGNVCDIYEFSSTYSFHLVEYHCLKFIDRLTVDVLKSPAFLQLRKPTVINLLKRQSLNVPSEMVIFRAVLTWGLNDCMRRGVDSESLDVVLKSVKPLLECVRFLTMSVQEMSDPDVDKFYRLLCSDDIVHKTRSSLNSELKTRSCTTDSSNVQERGYVPNYAYELEMVSFDQHAVRNGETFCLRIEVLKGRVFLTGVSLAFERNVHSKSTSCLYVAMSATNVQTADQICTRATFMISSEEAALHFSSPLVARESDSLEIALHVKRAVNICPMVIKSDSQIAVHEKKEVALKILPSSAKGGTERSMFKGIKYFY